MNRMILGKWLAFASLMALPFAGGCLQEAVSSTPTTNTVTAASTNAAAINLAPAAGSNTVANASGTNEVMEIPEVDIAEADYKPVQVERPVPASVRTNGPVGEIIRMSESGVEAGVLLAFVTNSTSVFSLSADEVIYLNDIGVPSEVVTAMLQQDQALRGNAPVPAAAAAPEAAPAVAPQIASNAANAAPAQTAAAIAPQSTAPPPQAAAPQPAPAPQGEQPPPPAEGQTAQAVPAQAPPNQVVNYNTFHSTLSPYGNWVYIQGYGQVWQPTVVVANPSWEPYVHGGRWLYTDAGWYWTSDYSWGWAPFHYGRWFRHYRLGWCWYPDYTWSPAWVSWRWNDGYCGWAALPPAAVYRPGFGLTYWGHRVNASFSFGLGYSSFTFVSWNHFHRHHHHHHRIHGHHARSLWDASHPYHRFDGDRHHVRNHGPAPERVARATGTEVRRVSLKDTVEISRGARAERLASDGRTLQVFRPRLADNGSTLTRSSLRGNDSSSGAGAPTRSTAFASSSLAERRASTRPAPAPSTVANTPESTGRRNWERPVPAVSRISKSELDSRMARLETPRVPQSGLSSGFAGRQSTITRDNAGTRPGAARPDGQVATPNNQAGRPSISLPNRTTEAQPPTVAGRPDLQRQSGTTLSRPERSVTPSRDVTAQDTASRDVTAQNPALQRRSTINLPNTAAPSTSAGPQARLSTQPQPAQGANAQAPAPSRIYMGSRQGGAATTVPNTTPSPQVRRPSSSAPVPNYNLGSGQPRSSSVTREWQPPQPAPAQRATPTPPVQGYSAPQRTYTPSQQTAPSYSVPQRSYTPVQPVPSYSAPQRSAPAYSAPQRATPSYSAPQRSYSPPPAPVQSAPSRSYSAPAPSAPQSSQRSFGSSTPGNFSSPRSERSTAFGNRN